MSIQAQERIATRLTILMAIAVAVSLLLVGWTLDRPTAAPAATPVSIGADR